jgi:AraC-like DNA-binding protein
MGASHAQPTWTLALPRDGGKIFVRNGRPVAVPGRGVLLPPQCPHRLGMDGAHVVMNLEAWMAPRARSGELRVLEQGTTLRLLKALDLEQGINLDAAVTELGTLVGGIGPVDSRLGVAMDNLAEIDRLDLVAADVGLTPGRLRVVVRSRVGVPLRQLRLWSRLVRAMAWLPEASTGFAGTLAGFADQPHFTRAARRMLGRTPGQLRSGIARVAESGNLSPPREVYPSAAALSTA